MVYLKVYKYFKNTAEENIIQEFRLKNTDDARNYFHEETEQNELMSRNYKSICTTLNYTEHFLILASASTACISISVFVSCAIATAIKKYTSKKKKKRKCDKVILLSRSKSNSIDS